MLTLGQDYEPIASAIRSAKWARILRNKISFHYDPVHGLEGLEKLGDDHPMKLVAGRIKGLTLFDFAEDIVTRPTFEMAGKGDIGQGMDTIHKFIVDSVSAITSFHAKATISIFEAYGMISERTQTEVREQYCGAPGGAHVPISISSKYLSELSRRSHGAKPSRR
jgi:hypothetical protein